MDKYNSTTIDSLSEFTKQIELRKGDSYKILLFRGQPVDKPLIPKIARHRFKKSRIADEQIMLNEFSTSSVQYLNFQPSTDIEKMTIAQHHGLPTRLLDWTENALTALYFAVSDVTEPNSQAVVWVMSVKHESNILLTKSDLNKDIFTFSEHLLFKPASIIPRISSQNGWFTIHPYTINGYYSQAEQINDPDIKLSKVLIKKGTEKVIKDNLEICGINRHSIFKDLDSLGSHIFEKFKK